MFVWLIITLKGSLFLNSCKVECERPLNCLSEQSEDDIKFNDLSRLFNSSLKLLICDFCHVFLSNVPKTIKDSVIFVKKSGQVYSYNFCKDVDLSYVAVLP